MAVKNAGLTHSRSFSTLSAIQFSEMQTAEPPTPSPVVTDTIISPTPAPTQTQKFKFDLNSPLPHELKGYTSFTMPPRCRYSDSNNTFKAVQVLPRSLNEHLHMNMLLINVERFLEVIRCTSKRIHSELSKSSSLHLSKFFSQSPLLSLITYFFDWHIDNLLDQLQFETFGCHAPIPAAGFAIVSETRHTDDETFVLFSSSFVGSPLHWTVSQYLTTMQLHMLTTVCLTFLPFVPKELNAHISALISKYGVLLPLSIPHFSQLSFDSLTLLMLQKSPEIYNSARLLLHGLVDRLGEEKCAVLSQEWISKFLTIIPQELHAFIESSTGKIPNFPEPTIRELRSIILISNLIIRFPNIYVPTDALHRVTVVLVLLLYKESDTGKLCLALDLLRKGASNWKNFIPDMRIFILQLWKLYWQCSLDTREDIKLISTSALRNLIVYGTLHPRIFAQIIGGYVKKTKLRDSERNAALIMIRDLVRHHSDAVYPELSFFVEIIIRCLDPSEPDMRHRLLEPSTKCLKECVSKYPMVSFNQESQHFAVGTTKSQQSLIIVYDLRTATKWRILHGHTGTLSAIAFNENADLLASYSHDENPATVRIWKTGSSGFLGGLLGMSGSCIKQINIEPIRSSTPITSYLSLLKIQFSSKKRVKLIREDNTICNFDTS